METSSLNYQNISEIHPLSPIFTYTNKISGQGMRKHIRFLAYHPQKNDFVDISEIVSSAIDKKYSIPGILFSGVGVNAQIELFERFKDKFKSLTGKDFKGIHERFDLNEKNLVPQYQKNFLDKKENKLKYASMQQQANSKFVYDCVKVCGCSIQYANSKLLNNKKIALAAISDDGVALRHLGAKIKDSEEYVRLVVETHPKGHLWASSRIIAEIEKSCPDNPKAYLDSYLLQEKLEQTVEDKSIHKKKVKL